MLEANAESQLFYGQQLRQRGPMVEAAFSRANPILTSPDSQARRLKKPNLSGQRDSRTGAFLIPYSLPVVCGTHTKNVDNSLA